MPFVSEQRYYNSCRKVFGMHSITLLAENIHYFLFNLQKRSYILATNTYVTFKLFIILMCSVSCVENKLNITLKTLFGRHNYFQRYICSKCEKYGFETKHVKV